MDWITFEKGAIAIYERHREIVLLFLAMLVMTMRPTLPWPFNLVPPLEWSYEWVRDALQSFFEKVRPGMNEKVSSKTVEVQTTVATSETKEQPTDESKSEESKRPAE